MRKVWSGGMGREDGERWERDVGMSEDGSFEPEGRGML